jgi:hypothetical protein
VCKYTHGSNFDHIHDILVFNVMHFACLLSWKQAPFMFISKNQWQ